MKRGRCIVIRLCRVISYVDTLHDLDVIKTADWIIDMGPEGGDGGGLLLAEGTPETVAGLEQSYTGRYLGRFFEK